MLEYGAAVEIFASHAKNTENWYKTKVVASDSKQFSLVGGGELRLQHGLESLPDCSTIVIPGWRNIYEKPPTAFLVALTNAYAAGARLVSFCSGAFVLAEAGLLDGKPATTHWKYADEFSQRFPNVNLQINKLYVRAENIYTSAGSAACLDLSVELIRQDFGIEQANSSARRLVIPGHRDGGQKQFIELPVPRQRSELGHILDWAIQNLDQQITVEKLVARSAMSRRTFDRKFNSMYGMTPKRWLINAQLERAKFLLESSAASIEDIATNCGFATALSLRLNFDKLMGIAPNRYRKQFSKNI